MNRKLLKILSLTIATASILSLTGCTINIDQDLVDSLKGETTETHNRRDNNDSDDSDEESGREESSSDENNVSTESSDNNDNSNDVETHDPNQTLEGIASIEDQVALIVANRQVWEFDDYADDAQYYAITDFDRDNHYEILCVATGGSGKYSSSKIYEVNNECTGLTLMAEFEPDYSWEESSSTKEIDWFNSDYNYTLLPDGSYSYEMFDVWSAGATEFGVVKINVTFSESGASTVLMGTTINTNDSIEYYNANSSPISESEYETLYDSVMLSGTTFGSVHISYTPEFYPSHNFSDVSDSELTDLLMTSANEFAFCAG